MVAKQLTMGVIRTDGGTQMRAELDRETYMEYRDLWKAEAAFPPIDVFHDGSTYWLADGFHRFYGAREAGLKSIPATIHSGTQRDAILFAVGANQSNGLRRKNADKRRAVTALLNDWEWVKKSDRDIADKAGVGHPLVSECRRQLEESSSSPAAKTKDEPRKGKDGKSRKPPAPKQPKPTPAAPEAEPELELGDCPRGGDHEFDRECCVKCLEPKPKKAKPSTAPPEPSKPTFDDSLILTAIFDLRKLISNRAKVHGISEGFDACTEELDHLQSAFTLWQEATP